MLLAFIEDMEARTTIGEVLNGKNKIKVPTYQRAYSWDTPEKDSNRSTQVDVFLEDLEKHYLSKANSSYYFGHFLFEKIESNNFHIIDGQQRMTTIVICVSALLSRLKELRELNEEEEIIEESVLKRRSSVHFRTVDYDNRLFTDYIIERNKHEYSEIETISALRFIKAFDYFVSVFKSKEETYIIGVLKTIINAVCTTHEVEDEAEAIQMFIFQNNRGKSPSNLEIIKAQFMYYIHLHGEDDREDLLQEVKDRFETIYKSIAQIETIINEDDVLSLSLKLYYNTLTYIDALDRINKELSSTEGICFIKDFSRELTRNFDILRRFYNIDSKKSFSLHSLVVLGGTNVSLPFVLKGYKFGFELDKIEELCNLLEKLVLRNRLIGTRADILTRLNYEVFPNFVKESSELIPLYELVSYMKETNDGWWGYWNTERLRESVQGYLRPSVAKFILWKYENYLIQTKGEKGYTFLRYDQIENPELEHFAPQTEPIGNHGYDEYTEEFKHNYLDCLGNYLLLSKSHNGSISNGVLSDKISRYTALYQQREMIDFIGVSQKWDKEAIVKRKEVLVDYIVNEF